MSDEEAIAVLKLFDVEWIGEGGRHDFRWNSTKITRQQLLNHNPIAYWSMQSPQDLLAIVMAYTNKRDFIP